MKITKKQIVSDSDILGHIVLHGISSHKDICKEIASTGEATLCFTVNGMEIDIQSFVDHWQGQVKRMIKEEANKIVEERFNTVRDSIDSYSQALSEALESVS